MCTEPNPFLSTDSNGIKCGRALQEPGPPRTCMEGWGQGDPDDGSVPPHSHRGCSAGPGAATGNSRAEWNPTCEQLPTEAPGQDKAGRWGRPSSPAGRVPVSPTQRGCHWLLPGGTRFLSVMGSESGVCNFLLLVSASYVSTQGAINCTHTSCFYPLFYLRILGFLDDTCKHVPPITGSHLTPAYVTSLKNTCSSDPEQLCKHQKIK